MVGVYAGPGVVRLEPAMTTGAPIGPSAEAVRSGACVAVPLPIRPESAHTARQVVGRVAEQLGLPSTLADDLMLVASELATNALRHGGGRVRYRGDQPVEGLPELWLYLRGTRRTELVVTAFDTGEFWDAGVRVPENGAVLPGVSGRGLQIVAALAETAGGRWGMHPSRARLGEGRPAGTAVWFAVPVPDHARVSTRGATTPAGAIDELRELLRLRGLDHLIARTNGREAVLSLPGLTVWYRRESYSWCTSSGVRHVVVADVVDAGEQVLAESERLSRRAPGL
ncbi:ATP-binding protein [Actinoallomurus sp. NPDC052308]|uniref:ATP-binding protein n=1 Tax=Actinoallomurus sp. NPDC052308 TaxID=3155530 RepID=UPI003419E63F